DLICTLPDAMFRDPGINCDTIWLVIHHSPYLTGFHSGKFDLGTAPFSLDNGPFRKLGRRSETAAIPDAVRLFAETSPSSIREIGCPRLPVLLPGWCVLFSSLSLPVSPFNRSAIHKGDEAKAIFAGRYRPWPNKHVTVRRWVLPIYHSTT